MRKLLIVLFVGFLLFDLLLAIKIFYPQLAPKQGIRSISVRSEIAGQRAHLTNEGALRKKLDNLDFWSKQRVNRYKLVIDKVTVEHLVFVLTDRPQYFGQRIDNGISLYSYGQKYDANTKTMEVFIQIHPEYKPLVAKEKRYSLMAMYAAYELVNIRPKNENPTYDHRIAAFIASTPIFFRFGII